MEFWIRSCRGLDSAQWTLDARFAGAHGRRELEAEGLGGRAGWILRSAIAIGSGRIGWVARSS